MALGIDHHGRLDRADLILQVPVAPEQLGPSLVQACRDVGAGQQRQFIDQALALGAGSQITAIEHQVGVRGQRFGPAGHLRRMLGERRGIQPGVAKGQALVVAVTEDVNRPDVGVLSQGLSDDVKAILVGLNDHDVHLATCRLLLLQIGQQDRLLRHQTVQKNKGGGHL